MRSRRRSREPEVDPFYDMLFNMLIAFVFCFILALLAINPKALKAGDVEAKAEYILTLSWPDNDPNDLDTWVQGPSGDLIWFRSREAGLMHLDRDDRGLSNDTVTVNGKKIVNPLNQEVVTIRGISAGEYIVNAHYYETQKGDGGEAQDAKTGGPVDATITVVKVNPVAEVVYYGQRTLPKKGAEVTMVRFTVQPDGKVSGINTLAKRLASRS
ncbi:MAG: hypothetical protein K0U93_11840 [Gammaproteobacteria bacterium]|nr:hypothetical protein [Gammaproteobacteria bacterium]